ncbi:MAG: phage holin family protein [Clostridiales bacterium]|nr:phage holin family protein [Clostridiales bacterium]
MKDVWKGLSGTAGMALTWVLSLLGGWDAALGMMLLLMGLDLFTGVVASLRGKSTATPGGGFLSRVLFDGISRKLMMMALVMLAAGVDRMMNTSGICRMAAVGFYAANEGMSVVENAALLGVPFPQKVLQALEKLKTEDSQPPDQAP